MDLCLGPVILTGDLRDFRTEISGEVLTSQKSKTNYSRNSFGTDGILVIGSVTGRPRTLKSRLYNRGWWFLFAEGGQMTAVELLETDMHEGP